MPESIQIALEIYLMGFAISIIIAALIKGMQAVIQHLSPEKSSAPQTDFHERITEK